jgi:hypothetical protein
MATKPGPALALAALAALFLLKGKGGKGGGQSADDADNVPEGTEVPDDTPKTPGSPSGGGKKVPKGTGAGGGAWDPGKLGPTSFWISPDCRNVIQGVDHYDKVLAPAMVKVFADISKAQDDYFATVDDSDPTSFGGKVIPDLYSVLAAALGFRRVGTEPGKWFVDTEFAEKVPGTCILAAPMFHLGNEAGQFDPENNPDAFNAALAEYFSKYPQLGMWLFSLQGSMIQDERFPIQARQISDIIDLSVALSAPDGAIGNPPAPAPKLQVESLFSLSKISDWMSQANAYASQWGAQFPKVINEYKSFVGDWYAQATANGTKLPVKASDTLEQAAKEKSPATYGVVIGRVLTQSESGGSVALPQPLGGASVTAGGKNAQTDAQGYFEMELPAGWHPAVISKGPQQWDAYISVDESQSKSLDLIATVA